MEFDIYTLYYIGNILTAILIGFLILALLYLVIRSAVTNAMTRVVRRYWPERYQEAEFGPREAMHSDVERMPQRRDEFVDDRDRSEYRQPPRDANQRRGYDSVQDARLDADQQFREPDPRYRDPENEIPAVRKVQVEPIQPPAPPELDADLNRADNPGDRS